MLSKMRSKAIALRLGVLMAFMIGLIGTSPIQSVIASTGLDLSTEDQHVSVSPFGGRTMNRIGGLGKPTRPSPKPTKTSTSTVSPTVVSSPSANSNATSDCDFHPHGFPNLYSLSYGDTNTYNNCHVDPHS